MNQILLGPDAGIDTDEVAFWRKIDDGRLAPVRQTQIVLRSGAIQTLEGDTKTAFDAWAAGKRIVVDRGVPDCPSCKSSYRQDGKVCCRQSWPENQPDCYEEREAEEAAHIEKLTAMAYKQGVRAGREEMDEFYSKRAIPSCQTCVYHDWKISPCQLPIGAETFPDCYKERPGPSGTADGETMEEFVAWAKGERQVEVEEACPDQNLIEGSIWELCRGCYHLSLGAWACMKKDRKQNRPNCYEGEKTIAEIIEEWRTKGEHPDCVRCRRYDHKARHCLVLSRSYPKCYKEWKVGVASMCKGCRSYNSETGLCTNRERFKRRGWPLCRYTKGEDDE